MKWGGVKWEVWGNWDQKKEEEPASIYLKLAESLVGTRGVSWQENPRHVMTDIEEACQAPDNWACD